MTTQHQPQSWPPQQHRPTLPPAPPIPPKRHSRLTAIILASVAVVATLVALSYALQPTTPATPAPAVHATQLPAVTEPAVTESAATFDTPALADFKLTVKELTRQRFGSAGDLVDYRVQLTQVRDRSYNPDKDYELTYKITGGEDGAETQTMTIRGDEYASYEGNAATHGGVKIKATPTGIEEV